MLYTVLVATQDFWLPLVWRVLGTPIAKFLLVAKLFAAIAICLALLVRKGRRAVMLPSGWALLLGLVVVVYLLVGGGGARTGAKLAAASSIASPVVLFCMGLWLEFPRRQIVAYVRWISGFAVLSVLFGFFDQFLLSVSTVWVSQLNLTGYLLEVKGVAPYSLDPAFGLPYNFFFGYFLGGGGLRRLVGFGGSPLATAYFLMILVVMLAALAGELPRRTRLVILVLGAGLLGTLTRGAIVSCVLAFAVLSLAMRVRSPRLKARAGVGLLLIGLTTLFLASGFGRSVVGATLTGTDGSTSGHISGTRAGIDGLGRVLVVGKGLASAGGAAQQDPTATTNVGENAFLVVAVQLGAVAGIALLLWLVSIAVSLRQAHRRTKDPLFAGGIAAVAGLVASCLFSEQLLTFTTFVNGWLLLGMLVSLAHERMPGTVP